jgi:hypothetical protein
VSPNLIFVSTGFVFGALILVSAPAHAQNVCAPLLTLPAIIQTPAYDPFAQGPVIEESEISFQGGQCDGQITLDTTIGWGSAQPRLTNQGNELAFTFLFAGRNLTSGISGLGESISPSNGVSVSLPTGATGTLMQLSRLYIPEGQIVPPGLYRFEVAGVATGATGLLSQVQGTQEVRAAAIMIETQVLAVMKLGVIGCDLSNDGATVTETLGALTNLASACQLNLGDPMVGMVNGDRRRARLNAQANVNFKISMVSHHGGVLKLAGREGDVTETEQIRYSASLEGQGQSSAFDCSSASCGTSDYISPSNSPLGTDLYFQVRVTEPEMTQKRAGKYSDTITLIIQPAS